MTNKNQITKKQKSWRWVNLADVLVTGSGGTPSTIRNDFWEGGNIPWINSGALKDTVISNPTSYITEQGLLHSSTRLFPKKTVLVALTGSNLGKIGLLSFNCCTNQSVTGIYPSNFLNEQFLFYYFLFIKTELIKKATGSAQPHINKKTIDETKIPIPPIEHQKESVEILNKIFKEIEELNLKANKVDLLEEEAFNGFIQEGNKLFQKRALGDFCKHQTKRIGESWKGKRLIGVSNEFGITDLRVSRRKTFENYKIVNPGDFIYNPMRIDIGSIAIFEGKEIALTSPDYVVFSVTEHLSKRFLLKFLKSELGVNEINNRTRGSVRSRLYFESLIKINIPFCGNKCQEKAEAILQNFSNIKLETRKILQSMSGVLLKSFDKCFSEINFQKIKFQKSSEELIRFMKAEKKTNIPLFKKSDKLNLNGMKNNASRKKNVASEQTIKNKKEIPSNKLLNTPKERITKDKKSKDVFTTEKSILEILLDSPSKNLLVEEVWQKSKYHNPNDIEGFYEELELLITPKKSQKAKVISEFTDKSKTQVILKIIK